MKNILQNKRLMSILSYVLCGVVLVLAIVSIVLMSVPKKAVTPSGDKPIIPAPQPPSPPAAHVHGNLTPSVTLEPNCTDDGVTAYICDDCHGVVRTEAIDPVGHDYTDAQVTGLCKTCGVKISTFGLTYDLSSDGTYYIVSNKNHTMSDPDLVIPEYYNGKPVKELASDAFVEQKYIVSVSIPSTMEYIGVGAFSTTNIRKLYYNAANCKDFVGVNWVFYVDDSAPGMDVTIGKAVRHIPERLFFPRNSEPDVLPKIKSIKFEAGSRVESIGEYAFYRAQAKALVLPDTLKAIGAHAFDGTAVESVEFGTGLESVGAHAFDYCNKLKSVDLSMTSLDEIAQNAFKNCAAVTEVKLPTSAKRIGVKAFFGCTALETLVVSGEEIGDDAFNGCTALSSVTLSKSIKRLGLRVFEGCVSLSEIIFGAESMDDLVAGNRVFYGAGVADGVTVVISDGVKYIPSRLFFSSADESGNLHIKKLQMASSVTEIGAYAFRGAAVDYFGYKGTAAEYDDVVKGVGNTELGTPVYEGEA